MSPSRKTTCCTPAVVTRSTLTGNSRPSHAAGTRPTSHHYHRDCYYRCHYHQQRRRHGEQRAAEEEQRAERTSGAPQNDCGTVAAAESDWPILLACCRLTSLDVVAAELSAASLASCAVWQSAVGSLNSTRPPRSPLPRTRRRPARSARPEARRASAPLPDSSSLNTSSPLSLLLLPLLLLLLLLLLITITSRPLSALLLAPNMSAGLPLFSRRLFVTVCAAVSSPSLSDNTQSSALLLFALLLTESGTAAVAVSIASGRTKRQRRQHKPTCSCCTNIVSSKSKDETRRKWEAGNTQCLTPTRASYSGCWRLRDFTSKPTTTGSRFHLQSQDSGGTDPLVSLLQFPSGSVKYLRSVLRNCCLVRVYLGCSSCLAASRLTALTSHQLLPFISLLPCCSAVGVARSIGPLSKVNSCECWLVRCMVCCPTESPLSHFSLARSLFRLHADRVADRLRLVRLHLHLTSSLPPSNRRPHLSSPPHCRRYDSLSPLLLAVSCLHPLVPLLLHCPRLTSHIQASCHHTSHVSLDRACPLSVTPLTRCSLGRPQSLSLSLPSLTLQRFMVSSAASSVNHSNSSPQPAS